MDLHDWTIVLMLGALVVWCVGRLLIRAFFAAKRHHQQEFMRQLYNGDEIS
jgi:uncharacterized membrane protein YdjX (TVP38/TMEM64 family)